MATLGFGQVPKPKKIFIEARENSVWHYWDADKKQAIPETEPSVICYITGVSVFETVNEMGDVKKLLIHIKADKNYIIQSGFHTWFSKTFISSALTFAKKDPAIPVCIQPYVSNNSKYKVVFCRLLHPETGESFSSSLDYTTPNEYDWDELVKELSVIFSKNTGGDQIKFVEQSINLSSSESEIEHKIEEEEKVVTHNTLDDKSLPHSPPDEESLPF